MENNFCSSGHNYVYSVNIQRGDTTLLVFVCTKCGTTTEKDVDLKPNTQGEIINAA